MREHEKDHSRVAFDRMRLSEGSFQYRAKIREDNREGYYDFNKSLGLMNSGVLDNMGWGSYARRPRRGTKGKKQ